MTRFVAIWLLVCVAVLTGCASLVHGRDRTPTTQELVGTYDWGHGGSSETWELREDQTFSRTLHEHLGAPSVTFAGIWSLEQGKLLLAEAPPPKGTGKQTVAEAFFYKREPAFARTQERTSECMSGGCTSAVGRAEA
jgi:hypothetical protein